MANHAYVKDTKVPLTAEAITATLDKLNRERFFGLLTIEYTKTPKDQMASAWGPHVWVLTLKNDKGEELVSRVCFLKGKHFELRHGSGNDLSWWVDHSVTNQVALDFQGTISDDGVGETWQGQADWCPTFKQYLMEKWNSLKLTKALVKVRLLAYRKFYPKQFLY